MAQTFTTEQVAKKLSDIRLSPWHEVGSDASLQAFTLGGRSILLDLTADDTFLEISQGSLKPLKMHKESDVTYAAITLTIPEKWLKDMRALDKRLFDLVSPSGNVSWNPLLDLADGVDEDHGTELHCRLVLDHSEAPSSLRFLTDAGIKTGEGLDFLQANLDGLQMKDFVCSGLVELQYVARSDPYLNLPADVLATLSSHGSLDNVLGDTCVVVTVHDILFVKPPRLQVAKIPEDRLEALARAAKRMRVRVWFPAAHHRS